MALKEITVSSLKIPLQTLKVKEPKFICSKKIFATVPLKTALGRVTIQFHIHKVQWDVIFLASSTG